MLHRVRRPLLLGLHQIVVAVGILLFPLELAAHRAGLRLPVPIARLVDATGRALENATN
ncbi:hypothetical protein [Haloparvum sp. AD34]